MIELGDEQGDVLLPVKVVPGASRDRLMGELDGALKIAVAAPPEKGAANKAVCTLLAKTLGLRRQQVTIAAGQTSPHKTVRITGSTPEHVRAALALS